jgi:hypothetical protein
MAKSVSIHVCEHGTTSVRLHDEQGNIFAVAAMPAETACTFGEQLWEKLQQYADGEIAPDGHVH